MTRRERLLASLHGDPVDRPAVNFGDFEGFESDPYNPDPFGVREEASWKALRQLAEEQSDLILMRHPVLRPRHMEAHAQHFQETCHEHGASRFRRLRLQVDGHVMQQIERRDRETDAWWTTMHLMRDEEDVLAFLKVPNEAFQMEPDCAMIKETDTALGDKGLPMIDMADPLGVVASYFSAEDFLVLAVARPDLLHRLLEKVSLAQCDLTEQVAKQCPGFLWRLYGCEHAAEPYLSPKLFREFDLRYAKRQVDLIHASDGLVRVHCHGRTRNILQLLVDMGADAVDPLEQPPQGDVNLFEVRARYGLMLTLFGNIQPGDIERLEPAAFEDLVERTLEQGTAGAGRGFVLMPSAPPFGQTISGRALANYEIMLRVAADFIS